MFLSSRLNDLVIEIVIDLAYAVNILKYSDGGLTTLETDFDFSILSRFRCHFDRQYAALYLVIQREVPYSLRADAWSLFFQGRVYYSFSMLWTVLRGAIFVEDANISPYFNQFLFFQFRQKCLLLSALVLANFFGELSQH